MAHGRVVLRCEHKSETGFLHTTGYTGRRQVDGHTDGFQKIGCAALAGDAAIAVLGDPGARRGDDQRGHRADVERAGAVAACTDDVHHVTTRIDVRGRGAHDLGQAGDLFGRFALHAQGDREASDLRRRRFAIDERTHRRPRFHP